MENGWSLFSNITDSGNGAVATIGRGQNGHSTNNVAWDIWDNNTTNSSRYDWCNHTTTTTSSSAVAAAFHPLSAASAEASAFHALLFNPADHLMCLKLGKRHYFEDPINYAGGGGSGDSDALYKRGKTYYGLPPAAVTVASVAPPPVVVPKCQVEGCHVALLHAKEYHRRHKVCEMHSKAPRVMVFGQEQRFCQQCSRFHGVGEFDESKRSCRRRLAGHNERRRKGSSSINGGSIASISLSKNTPRGRALSLLSSKNNTGSWISSADLSLRCSAALSELIAENRAAIFGRAMWNNVHNTTLLDSDNTETYKNNDHHQQQHQSPVSSAHHNQEMLHDNSHVWNRFHTGADTTMTLNLRQAPNSAFGFLSVRGKSKETEDCPDFWTTLGDTHVV